MIRKKREKKLQKPIGRDYVFTAINGCDNIGSKRQRAVK
jgi:hypothetical protein